MTTLDRTSRVSRSLLWLIAIAIVLPLLAAACGKSIGETVDDATITARVKTALLNDPSVSAMRIDVDTTKGVVTMSGVVKSQAEEQRAIQIARGIPGVRDVKSTLQVGGGEFSTTPQS
ncbi:MAG: BON domain-containing protein [Betaproteobacteria bacterium]